MGTLVAGAAAIDISPTNSVFLFGYPHVERYSSGIHDPLLSSALYLSDGLTELMFIANDIIFVSKAFAEQTRQRIEAATGVPAANIMITATHTHSGPITIDYISNEADAAVPPADRAYVDFFEDQVVAAATEARKNAQSAEVGSTIADATGIGTNRMNPDGPTDPEVPVLMLRATSGGDAIACMVVYSMHPTVLHKDSLLISGDFPAMTRQYLQENGLGTKCPVLYHTGPAGNQSLRHVTRENTFAEAERLGNKLGRAIAKVIPEMRFTATAVLSSTRGFLDLPRKEFPTLAQAEKQLESAHRELTHLRQTNAPRQLVRTAEVNWFGAEETVTLSRAAREGRLECSYQSCLPAEVQVFGVGPWSYVGWPGEIFVDHALRLKAQCPNTFVISLANGELQGYIVTEEAADQGGYEASNGIFNPQSGKMLVEKSLELMRTRSQ